MNTSLRTIARLNGWACIAVGAGHLAFGVERSVPGAGAVSPTVESQKAFYNCVFLGYGLSWLHASRDDGADRVLEAAGIMALGGVARLVVMARRGAPHPLYAALTAVEFAVPALVVALARRDGASASIET